MERTISVGKKLTQLEWIVIVWIVSMTLAYALVNAS